MAEARVRNLELHEAIMLVMLEHKLATGSTALSSSELAAEIQDRKLYFRLKGDFADASQIGARANQYPALFSAVFERGKKRLVLNELPRVRGEVVANLVANKM